MGISDPFYLLVRLVGKEGEVVPPSDWIRTDGAAT